MSNWITPIFDRTNEDVLLAQKQGGHAMECKGALNATDLNRIEGNFKHVRELLALRWIFVPMMEREVTESWFEDGKEKSQVYDDWARKNLLWQSEMDRIRDNYNALHSLYLLNMGLPASMKSYYLDYVEVNAWEQATYEALGAMERTTKVQVYCGTITCGGGAI